MSHAMYIPSIYYDINIEYWLCVKLGDDYSDYKGNSWPSLKRCIPGISFGKADDNTRNYFSFFLPMFAIIWIQNFLIDSGVQEMQMRQRIMCIF